MAFIYLAISIVSLVWSFCVEFDLAESGDTNDKFYMDKFSAATDVEFETLSPDVINAYIDTGEPMLVCFRLPMLLA